MGVVLAWLIDHGIYIHFSNIDILYWSILDIVESVVADNSFRDYILAHREMKNELYRIVACDVPQFLGILKSHGYPNIERAQTGAFLGEVENFLEMYNPEDTNLPTAMLKALVHKAQRLKELVFLVDETEGMLIDSFHGFFLQPIYIFKNSLHIFDHEPEVERIFSKFCLTDGEREIGINFSNSKEMVGIQLSDVITGFLGKYFVFIEHNSIVELLNIKGRLNSVQVNNLKLLCRLIDASDEVSNGFFHRVAPMSSDWKSNSFLYDMQYPLFA